MWILWVVTACLVVSWVVTSRIRRYAVKHAILDFPNPRSSHAHPTPRGGGLGVIVPVAIALLTAPRFGAPPIFCIGGALVVTAVAALGWIDDHRSFRPRLAWLSTFALAPSWHS